MTSVMDQILTWSGSRQPWQQDALRLLVEQGSVSDETIETYAQACLGDGDETVLEPLANQHVPIAGTTTTPVTLTGIRGAENVNALATGESLTFAPSGLTIVYGDNGSGKSGYARVLKSVTRTRSAERVRSDIFRAGDLVPRSYIDYEVGGVPSSHEWTRDGPTSPDELSQLSFFDRSCSEVYLERATEVAFRPSGLDLFDELAAVCERVRAVLDRKAVAAGRRTDGLPSLADSTHAGLFLKTLSETSSDQAIADATAFGPEDESRLNTLVQAEEQLKQGTAVSEADRLQRLARRVERAQADLSQIATVVSATNEEVLMALRADVDAKATAARVARSEATLSAPLDGVGDAVWRVMWDAARSYSEIAYPHREFPVVDDALCLLCQQSLTDTAGDRLRRFEGFIRDTTQAAEDAARRSLSGNVQRLRQITIGDQATLDVVSDIRPEYPDLAAAIAKYLEDVEPVWTALCRIESDQWAGTIQEFPEIPSALLASTSENLASRELELRKSQGAEGAANLSAELEQLRARKTLSTSRDLVVDERNRLQQVAAITAAKSAAGTHAISQKAADVTNEVLTEVLIDRFSRETDRLGLENVVLRAVGGRRGLLMYRTGFVGAVQEAPLPEVLSEGEQTALGMAGFLSEVWTDPSKSGIIFDDPVSSLDHERRNKVAERLVTLATGRQTIVFTHDIAFVLALKKYAVQQGVQVTERSIERLHSSPGHCEDHHRFSAKLVKERVAELEAEIVKLRKTRDSLTNELYRDATEKWYKLLRRTWERAIEETLLGGILTRDELQVHPKMVRTLVLFTADDNRELQGGYGRATELSEVHEESPVINSPAPSPDEMSNDLQELKEWHKRVTSRANLQEQKIYEIADAANQ